VNDVHSQVLAYVCLCDELTSGLALCLNNSVELLVETASSLYSCRAGSSANAAASYFV
jgi:hypothetical protein